MKNYIIRKLAELNAELNKISSLFPHFDEREDYKIIFAQIELLNDILKNDARAYSIAILKDNQLNYDMGIISKTEYEENIEKIKNGEL